MKNPRRLRSTVLTLLTCSLVGMGFLVTLGAQTAPTSSGSLPAATSAKGEPPELIRWRTEYEKAVAEAVKPALRDLVDDLRELEKSSTLQGDYETTIQVRESLEQLLPNSTGSVKPKDNSITLNLSEAELRGRVTYDARSKIIQSWEGKTATASWKLSKAGSYLVELEYACAGVPYWDKDSSYRRPDPSGGMLLVSENTSLLGPDDNPPVTFKVSATSSTNSWNSFVTRRIGTVAITRQNSSIILKGKDIKPGGLIRIKRITLYPIEGGSGNLIDLRSDAPPPALAKLRNAYRKELTAVVGPLVESHLDALQELKSSLLPDSEDFVRLDEAISQARNRLINPGNEPQETIVLGLAGSKFSETIEEDGSNFRFKNLKPVGAYIAWDLRAMAPVAGPYNVQIEYYAHSTSGGSYELSCGASQLTGRVKGSTWESDESQSPGVILVPPGGDTLILKVSSLSKGSKGELFQLKSVTLSPPQSGDESGESE